MVEHSADVEDPCSGRPSLVARSIFYSKRTIAACNPLIFLRAC
jgi:hypothetical protein